MSPVRLSSTPVGNALFEHISQCVSRYTATRLVSFHSFIYSFIVHESDVWIKVVLKLHFYGRLLRSTEMVITAVLLTHVMARGRLYFLFFDN